MNDFLFLPKEGGLRPPSKAAAGAEARALARRPHARPEGGRPAGNDPVEGGSQREESFARTLEKTRKDKVEAPADAAAQAAPVQVSEQPRELEEVRSRMDGGECPPEAEARPAAAASGILAAQLPVPQSGAPLLVEVGVETGAGGLAPVPPGQAAALAGDLLTVVEPVTGGEAPAANGSSPAQPGPAGQPAVDPAAGARADFGKLLSGEPQAAPGAQPVSQAPAGGPQVVQFTPGAAPVGLADGAEQIVAAAGQPAATHPPAAQPQLEATDTQIQPGVESLSASADGRNHRPAGSALPDGAQPGSSNSGEGAQTGASAYDPAAAVQAAKYTPIEPARLAEARPSGFVEQLSRGISDLARSGQGTLRLQLHPEDLGKIDLRLSSGVDGLRVVLTASQSTTGELLERHLSELRQALEGAGVQLAGLAVGSGSLQGGSAQAGRWGARSGRGGQFGTYAGFRAHAGLDEATQPEISAPRRSLSPNGVDYWI